MKDLSYNGSIAFELYELTPTFTKGQYRGGQPTALTTVPGWQVDLYVDNGPPANTCFSADDATLVYTP